MNVMGPYWWWWVNTGSGNGLVPPGNKPLPGPMLTQFCVIYIEISSSCWSQPVVDDWYLIDVDSIRWSFMVSGYMYLLMNKYWIIFTVYDCYDGCDICICTFIAYFVRNDEIKMFSQCVGYNCCMLVSTRAKYRLGSISTIHFATPT